MIRNVWIVSREYDDVAGAGGLKDAVRGLALALVERDIRTTVVLPRYGFVEIGKPLFSLSIPAAGENRHLSVSEMYHEDVRILLLDNPAFSEKKDVYTYTEEDIPPGLTPGTGHQDVHLLNTLLQAGAIAACIHEGNRPDIIHGNDGHCGLLPLFMEILPGGPDFFRHTGMLLTVHNAGRAYQQEFENLDEACFISDLPRGVMEKGSVESRVNPILIAGIFGNLNTVSPGYARELRSGVDTASRPLASYLHHWRIPLPGIVNGLDPRPWLPVNGCSKPTERLCKATHRSLLAPRLSSSEFNEVTFYGGLPDSSVPWFLFHARLTHQKGVDAILDLPDHPPQYPCQLIVYGQGDRSLETRLAEKARGSGWLIYINGYNRQLTANLFSAASFTLIPSLWEPCGQTDMVGQLLGALPIVRRTGGLAKVRHRRTGFCYPPEDSKGLLRLINLAAFWEWKYPRRLSRMRRRAEKEVYEKRSWREVLVHGYLPLYRKARHNAGKRHTTFTSGR